MANSYGPCCSEGQKGQHGNHLQNPHRQSSLPQKFHILSRLIMSSFTANTPTLLHAQKKIADKPGNHQLKRSIPAIKASISPLENVTGRRKIVTFLSTSLALGQLQGTPPPALAEKWGTRSLLWEHFFQPDLSPEDAVARITQTAEGLHSIRDMLESMAWRYVMFYIRQKQAYLSKDLKNAFSTLPPNLREDYVKKANELVDNMDEFDSYVRTPRVYESYLYYEKTLKSIDDVVAILGENKASVVT
ncbi:PHOTOSYNTHETIC NDH SUBUNIT OF LUMENAL LOCATION 2 CHLOROPLASTIC [Salix viminalis]|uniref:PHOTOSYNTHETIC NDH SUBUNIT OF LUMENAL LOCATION 2 CHLOROPLASTIC n=1 Tax=Salix viminalis TaxID=40686 RepID=A0A9Q0TZS8_SALVM|nr:PHOTOSYNTHETIC NDH SUBUNIT OF LUMENAL LOCATION 2 CHLOROPLASTIC [Salix viminalis]